jgi:hypothetical protein
MDRHQISLFRRVEEVELSGDTIGPSHLRLVARFAALRSLVISHTAISQEDIDQWRKEHPSVSVTYYPRPPAKPT